MKKHDGADLPAAPSAVPNGVAADLPPVAVKRRSFDVDDPVLPAWVEEAALGSGGYPYDKKLKKEKYEAELELLQIELVKLQRWLQAKGERVLVLFEGRDAAGKGGSIDALRQHMNPRFARNVALPKPNDVERGQWYFQRYVAQFPTAGEFVTFDRSWYNRAGVEPVMGFCTPEEHERFLDEAPRFERMIVNSGIRFFKFWLSIGQEMQLKRFHDRRHSPLANWKFSPMDVKAIPLWDAYTKAFDEMFRRTHSKEAPWTVVLSNDKRRARLETMRRILRSVPYDDRDEKAIGKPDKKIVGDGSGFPQK
jgi:polyphosphate kinase